MGCSEASAVVAVEVLVEQDQVMPPLVGAEGGSCPGRTAQEQADEAGAEVVGDLPEVSRRPRPGRVLRSEVVTEVRLIERVLRAGSTVLFAHGHFLRILAARWLGQSPETGRLLALDTATISALGFERENRVIRRWNEGCDLRGIEAPM